ncbi:MAG: sulfurtransferase TusA family protein [Oscillospiraceae bacterium]|nr:sulfurtransferase TusA family protein [Oscillospiraceae bacterium]
MTTVDARGLSCPEPVMMTSKAMLTKEAEYVILVDNTCSRENVTRYAERQGYSVSVDEKGGEFALTLKK